MTSHYFTNDSKLSEELNIIEEQINGINYRFYTDDGVFSKSKVDYGSLLLVESLLKDLNDIKTFLDLGSGYGPIGIAVKKEHPNISVDLTDVNELAVLLAAKNSKLNKVDVNCYASDGFLNITKTFDVISLNPPIRTGKKIVFKLYEDAYKQLNKLGHFWIVIRKKQGALSHLEYLQKIFTNVEIVTKNKGYFVIKMQKV